MKDLPKADYDKNPGDSKSNYSAENYLSQNQIKKYGHLSQNKLREIIKSKDHQKYGLNKKLSLKKMNPENSQEVYESVRSKIYT